MESFRIYVLLWVYRLRLQNYSDSKENMLVLPNFKHSARRIRKAPRDENSDGTPGLIENGGV